MGASPPPFSLSQGLRSTATLNNGVRMPVLGLGVYQTKPGLPTREAVKAALGLGYRHIDTAALYANEADVGRAIRDSGVPREQVFVTTKVWNDDQGFDTTLQAFERSRVRLDLGPVDLYLMHWPVQRKRLETWRALGHLLKSGQARAVGVSNFTITHLEELEANSDLVPAVNQVEFSPFLFQRELWEHCRSRGIQLEAYAPLTRGSRLSHPVVVRMAEEHEATPAQILIRWGLQHQVVEIPKSVQRERIRENADVFAFVLTEPEMEVLDHLNEGFRTSWDPSTMP